MTVLLRVLLSPSILLLRLSIRGRCCVFPRRGRDELFILLPQQLEKPAFRDAVLLVDEGKHLDELGGNFPRLLRALSGTPYGWSGIFVGLYDLNKLPTAKNVQGSGFRFNQISPMPDPYFSFAEFKALLIQYGTQAKIVLDQDLLSFAYDQTQG